MKATPAHRYHSPPASTREKTPWITWVFGLAALIVSAAALALVLSPKPASSSTPKAEEDPTPIQKEVSDTPLLASNTPRPLDISTQFFKAQRHSKRWHASAMLVRIELIVVDGKPVGPVIFTFAPTIGQPIPGGSVGPQRFEASFDSDAMKIRKHKSARVDVALPEPTCPLAVAYRTLQATPGAEVDKVGVIYAHSKRHGRPVWLMTNSSGVAKGLSGEACHLLRR